MQPLTDRQQKIYDYICESIRARGYPPTLREIGAHMEIRSTNGVSDHLRALERKGYLLREDMKSRALRPVDPNRAGANGAASSAGADENMRAPQAARAELAASASLAANDDEQLVSVPVVGRVAAGAFAHTDDACDYRVTIDRAMLPHTTRADEVFALKVKGDSMIDAGILHGDTILVKRTPTASRGAIVVARLDEEATVKRFFPEREHVRLQPENKDLSPILLPKSDVATRGFEVLGVVVGLFRQVV